MYGFLLNEIGLLQITRLYIDKRSIACVSTSVTKDFFLLIRNLYFIIPQ